MVRYAFVAFVLLFAPALPRHRWHAAGQSGDFSATYHSNAADGFKAAVVAGSATKGSRATNVSAAVAYRLPGGVMPVSYALRVDTDLDALSYSGTVDIEMAVTAVVPKLCRIVLNAKEVRVTGVRVTDVNTGQSLIVAGRQMADEQLTVTMGGKCLIPSRRYVLTIDFEASLRDDMSGYYRSSYRDGNVTKYKYYDGYIATR